MKAPSLVPRNPVPVFGEEAGCQEKLFEIDPRPETLCFRGQTLAIMRHFFELSCQVGRLPSLLGREFFRAKVSHHAIPSFEEQAVFVRDVELCLARLRDDHAEMITLIGLYDFSRDEIAGMLGCSRTWVQQQVAQAVDALSEIFLQAGLLREDRPDRRQCQVTNRSIPADVAVAGPKMPPASTEMQGQGGRRYA
jgi:sigma-70-like protein